MALFAEGKLFREAGTGSGGGDKHNKGYFVDESALTTVYPTAEAGDYAIVESTDTVWVWDSDTSAWKDSDQKGQVTSVNGQTGDVTLTASDVSALPTSGGTVAGNIVFSKTGHNDKVIGNHNGNLRIGTSTTASNNDLFISTGSGSGRSIAFGDGNGGKIGSGTAKFERTYTQKLNNGADIAVPTVAGAIALQESTMPTADAASVGVVVQYVGATDATYTNGYFYKCVSDGQEPATYSWSQVSVQPAGATYTAGNGISIDANNEISAVAPIAYESAITGSPLVQKGSSATSPVGLLAIGNLAVAGGNNATAGNQCLAIGDRANAGNYQGHHAIAIGMGTENHQTMADQYSVAIGNGTRSLTQGVALGHGLKNGRGGIIIGFNLPNAEQIAGGDQCFDVVLFNTSTYVANQYRILDANGKIPVERINDSAVVKYSSMPEASLDNSGVIAQYAGGTDTTYTNGYFYKCSGVITAPSSVEVNTASTVDPTLVSADVSTLESWMVAHNKSIDYNSTIFLYCFGANWGIYVDGASAGRVNLADCGVTYSGTAQSGDQIYLNYTAATKEYSWVQTNVQPSGLPSTTGLVDGNYRLRLVMASGVPTLEWVAE